MIPRGDGIDLGDVMLLVKLTAADHQQRAVEVNLGGLDELYHLREQIRAGIGSTSRTSTPRHVVPWVWFAATTGGTARTTTGCEVGMELRLSWYRKAQG